MNKPVKFYTVWQGRQPGVYATWADCEAQVRGFPNAQFMAFRTRAEAEQALHGAYADYKGKSLVNQQRLLEVGPPVLPSWSVDAACSGSPGPVEYRGVDVESGRQVFHQGPFPNGTNNVGEFLAIVHALALLARKGSELPVYSDSESAIEWVKVRECRTTLARVESNAELFALIARAERWLRDNRSRSRVLKWETEAWGENPADFGRK
jgi:ribonuclease HI